MLRPTPDHTQHSQATDIHAPAGFEPAISTNEQPQTHPLDGAATAIGLSALGWCVMLQKFVSHLMDNSSEIKVPFVQAHKH
jgi:hypothetical protein